MLNTINILNNDLKTVVRLFWIDGNIEPDKNMAMCILQQIRGYEKEADDIARLLLKNGLRVNHTGFYQQLISHCEPEAGSYSAKLNFSLDNNMPAHEAMRVILRFLLSIMRQNMAGIRETFMFTGL